LHYGARAGKYTCAIQKGVQGEMSDASEMLSRAIKFFSNDGRLDVDELDQLVKIALADGVVDDEEKKVLKGIIYNLTSRDLTPDMWARVEEIVAHYGLDQ